MNKEKRKVVILPMDGYPTASDMSRELLKILGESDGEIKELLAAIKVNDAIHNPDLSGPRMVDNVKGFDLEVFIDLKVFDVSATIINVLKKYAEFEPDILTVCSQVSSKTMVELRKLLPKTKLAMVSALTDISEEECINRFGYVSSGKIFLDICGIEKFYKKQASGDLPENPFDLIVCSPLELEYLKKELGDKYGYIVPGIRDEWMKNPDEHQKRTTGVRQALESGATYVVMGAQMTKGNPLLGISASESRQRTKVEIDAYFASLKS